MVAVQKKHLIHIFRKEFETLAPRCYFTALTTANPLT